MSAVDTSAIADRLNRTVKLALDTGEVATVEEAERLFAGYSLSVCVGPEIAYSQTHQAALLTVVNTARRSLLGGVEVMSVPDAPLLVPLRPYLTLHEAIAGLGGVVVGSSRPGTPLVVIGAPKVTPEQKFGVRITFEGWAAGVVPLKSSSGRLAERTEFVPSGVFAGALAVAEAFQHLRGNQPAAGRRSAGLSLWRPDLDWQTPEATGPAITRLPSSLWLIGLGNLGQAYLWTLGLLPYEDPGAVNLVLQDFDLLAASNDSTSLLTHQGNIGTHKTRAMSQWADRRGFNTAIMERRFAANFHVGSDDPAIALCGVDNALARSALEDVGFTRVIECGLGGGIKDFLGFRTHVFPGARKARDIWDETSSSQLVRTDLPAYEALAASGADRCGLTQLAGRTVGAPFVGALAGSVVISELIRLANGAHTHDLLDGHLRELSHRTVVKSNNLPPFNPGTTNATPST
ncbi:hypothetical protein ACOJCM_09895 [Billgrantia sp. LNSP4103-1]|uniref:hypothetical protein n=1 Tax=Billgrantia sp. LNSP4103-1 TaxID=3410266 RepID=UPI00403F1945